MNEYIPGQAWSVTGSTGTMAASLAQDALVYAIGAVASDTTRPNFLQRGPLEIQAIRGVFSVIVASAAPATAGRALRLFKNSSAAGVMPTGGTALTPRPRRSNDQGGDSGLIGNIARIAGTAGLTAGAFARDTVPLQTFDLAGCGGAGGRFVFEFDEQNNGGAIWLDPGEILVISNPAAFEAQLTWQLTVSVDYRRRDTV